jgi:hypothetical protein
MFNVNQIKGFSRELVLLPAMLHDAKSKLEGVKKHRNALLDLDDRNKVFFDEILNEIHYCHAELRISFGEKRTTYLEEDLIKSAFDHHKGVPHFPINPVWGNLQPKLLDSNNGLPIDMAEDGCEEDILSQLVEYEDKGMIGFFNLVESYMAILDKLSKVSQLKCSSKTFSKRNDDNLVSISTLYQLIKSTPWNPMSIPAFKEAFSERLCYLFIRYHNLTMHLGHVSQNVDGFYTGSGLYFRLFSWIDTRIGLSGGSLTNFMASELAQKSVENQYFLLQRQWEQYGERYNATLLRYDAPENSIQFYVGNSAIFEVGQEIQLLDDNSIEVYTRRIESVDRENNYIIVDSPIPSSLTTLAVGRIITQL